MHTIRITGLALVCAVLASSCSTAYYGAMEKAGVHKREILVDRVDAAKVSQNEAKEQFKSALEQFSSVVQVDGGELEKVYGSLNREYERCARQAEDVNDRIAKVDDVAHALFKEWKAELRQYSNPGLRDASATQLADTREAYDRLQRTMRRAAATMNPVLDAFRDQVLFLKHNLNAKAIASVQNEAARIEGDVARLIRDMEASIAEAEAFLSSMSGNR